MTLTGYAFQDTLRAQDIADWLDVSTDRVYELSRMYERSKGERGLPCFRLGQRQLRFSRAAVEQWLLGIDNTVKETRNQ